MLLSWDLESTKSLARSQATTFLGPDSEMVYSTSLRKANPMLLSFCCFLTGISQSLRKVASSLSDT